VPITFNKKASIDKNTIVRNPEAISKVAKRKKLIVETDSNHI